MCSKPDVHTGGTCMNSNEMKPSGAAYTRVFGCDIAPGSKKGNTRIQMQSEAAEAIDIHFVENNENS